MACAWVRNLPTCNRECRKNLPTTGNQQGLPLSSRIDKTTLSLSSRAQPRDLQNSPRGFRHSLRPVEMTGRYLLNNRARQGRTGASARLPGGSRSSAGAGEAERSRMPHRGCHEVTGGRQTKVVRPSGPHRSCCLQSGVFRNRKTRENGSFIPLTTLTPNGEFLEKPACNRESAGPARAC